MIKNMHRYLMNEYNEVTGKFVFDKITKWFVVKIFMIIRSGCLSGKKQKFRIKGFIIREDRIESYGGHSIHLYGRMQRWKSLYRLDQEFRGTHGMS